MGRGSGRPAFRMGRARRDRGIIPATARRAAPTSVAIGLQRLV